MDVASNFRLLELALGLGLLVGLQRERAARLAGCAMGWIPVVAALRFDTRKLRALAALMVPTKNSMSTKTARH
jgi:hypothetical protein